MVDTATCSDGDRQLAIVREDRACMEEWIQASGGEGDGRLVVLIDKKACTGKNIPPLLSVLDVDG